MKPHEDSSFSGPSHRVAGGTAFITAVHSNDLIERCRDDPPRSISISGRYISKNITPRRGPEAVPHDVILIGRGRFGDTIGRQSGWESRGNEIEGRQEMGGR